MKTDITKLSLQEAKSVLKNLRLYEDMCKKLWARWSVLYKKIQNNEHSYMLQYHTELGEDDARKQWQMLFKKVFWVTPKDEQIICIENKDLQGGMRVFYDDNLIDISYKAIEKKLQK